MFVDGIITLVTAGRVWDSSGGASVHMSQALEDPNGAWEVPLVVRSQGVLLPSTLNADLTFGGPEPLSVTLLGDLSVNGTVRVGTGAELTLGDRMLGVNGDLEVANGGRLLMGRQEVRVEGSLRTLDTGTIVMDTEGQRLAVTGDATFGVGASTVVNSGALFSAGVFELMGNLTERLAHYRPSGTHLTRFVGSGPQLATMDCWYSDCGRAAAGTAPGFASVEVSNPTGVTFQGRRIPVSGDITVLGDAVATFSEWMDIAGSVDVVGSLTVTTGVEITIANTLFLRASGVLTNEGTMTAGTCQREDGHTISGTDPCR
jgi:hypothetical protein